MMQYEEDETRAKLEVEERAIQEIMKEQLWGKESAIELEPWEDQMKRFQQKIYKRKMLTQ